MALPQIMIKAIVNYMKKELFDHIDIDQNNAFIPECFDDNFELACSNFEDEIKNHGGYWPSAFGNWVKWAYWF